jgi:hypothetical protein
MTKRRRTKKCTRVADRAFPEIKITWRQPGDFGRYPTEDNPLRLDLLLIGFAITQ